jgi:hypothetical protein
MWLHLFTTYTGAVRVPSLRDHFRQNNDFLKVVYPETYLPPHQRLHWVLRPIRFLLAEIMMLLMAVAAMNNLRGDAASSICDKRTECLSYCQSDWFPNDICGVDAGITLKYRENKYDNLYFYYETDSDEFRNCKDYVADNPDYEDRIDDSSHEWKVSVCFRSCIYPGEVDTDFTIDERSECVLRTDTHGNPYYEYDLLCVHPDTACEKIHKFGDVCMSDELCFSMGYIWLAIFIANCAQLFFEAGLLYTLNVTYKPTSLELMVSPPKEEKFTGEEEEPSCEKVVMKCTGEMVVFIVFLIVIITLASCMIAVYKYGLPETVWFEFFLAFVLDQIKSLLIQPALWYVFVRHCGELTGSFTEWSDEQVAIGANDVSMLDEIREQVGIFLKSKWVSIFFTGLVVFYAVFILINLSIDPYIIGIKAAEDAFYYTDFICLCLFVLELFLSIFAWMWTHLCDKLNIIDAIVILVSFIFSLINLNIKGIGVLRLLRLIRVIIFMRKVSEKKKQYLDLIQQDKGVSTNVPRVLGILEELLADKGIPRSVKQDITWVTELIKNRKIYTTSMKDEEVIQFSEETLSWQREIMNPDDFSAVQRIGALKELAREKTLRRARQSSADMKLHNTDYYNERVDEALNLSKDTQLAIVEALTSVDLWTWDVFQFYGVADEKAFAILGMKLLLKYDIYKSCDMNLDTMLNFMCALQEGYSSFIPYHNAVHILDTVQATHYFYSTAGLENYLTRVEVFVGFIATFAHDYEHPGLTNQFLIRTKHPKAVRYSDNSPLENHHVAAVFKLMRSAELNLFDYMDVDTWTKARKMMTYIILQSDLSNHIEMYTNLQIKIQTGKFPENSFEDSVTLMAFILHCSDLSKAARPLNTYLKWVEKMMEEFYQQGEIESRLNLPISPFMDRENTVKERVQVTYIDLLIRPCLKLINILSPKSHENIIKKDLLDNGLEQNHRNQQNKVGEELKY